MKTKANKLKHLPIYIVACIWVVVNLYPLLFTVISSFKNNDEIFSSGTSALKLPASLRFSNYVEAFTKANMARCLMNSILIAGCSTLLVLLFASMVSYVISRFNYKINTALLLYFTLGVMIPIHTTLVPLLKIVNSLHGQNSYLMIIILYTTFNMPMAILLIVGHMKGITKSMDESAILDGCGPVRLFSSIILPLALPAISTAGIITFLYVYNDLLFGVMFISDKSMYTITLGMLTFVGSKMTEYGPIFASIIISVLPMIIIYLLFQEKVESGLAAGAVKE
ncbi:MAG TPA: carbohydrate ABC transporter permease [Ruminiclostridium sp.]|nr:carbohydrate ABC transporter permease [Ruminiclostridium sp.]